MVRKITLLQNGYYVRGTATINLWGGGTGEMEMQPVHLETLSTENVLRAINDNGFGCESYDKVEATILLYYGYGVFDFFKKVTFSRQDLWGITNKNCDFKKLAEDYEANHEPIIDNEV